MIRHATFEINEIFAIMDEGSPYFLPNGIKFKGKSDRLVLFRTKGTNCVSCDTVGAFFALESCGDETPHINLYGINGDGKERLMTKDHIHPKSRGGENHLDNYQPMCARCNGKKSNKV